MISLRWTARTALLCGVVWALLLALPVAAQDSGGSQTDAESEMYHEAYFVLDSLNEGLPEPEEAVNRSTPQATMELLVLSIRNGDYDRASHALNLNLLPTELQAARAADLAYRLHTVLTEQYLINWDNLPDRPDGVNDERPAQEQTDTSPQRSILLGTLDLDGRSVELRLERVKAGDDEPVWVVSSNTVENIDALYDGYGPSTLERIMPAWAQQTLWSRTKIWEWIAVLVLLVAAMAVGLAVRWAARRALLGSDSEWMQELADAAPLPLGVLAAVMVFYLPLERYISLTGPFLNIVEPLFFALLIGSVLWLVMRLIGFAFQYFSQQYAPNVGEDSSENIAQRRRALTTLSVARRVIVFTLVLVGLGIALSEFGMFRSLGITLLASAGVISVIVAVAAQPLLGSIVAGTQIAATDPIRIGDTVMFEGNWSEVEDITQTYVTLLTWDRRRLIVPLQYLSDHVIENWSKTDSHMALPLYLYLDYSVDVQVVREKFEELVNESAEFDGRQGPDVLVTELSEETMTVRCVASASTPSDAWALHCRLLEEMVAFVRELEDGRYLPQRRLVMRQTVRAEDEKGASVKEDQAASHNGSGDDANHDEAREQSRAAPNQRSGSAGYTQTEDSEPEESGESSPSD